MALSTIRTKIKTKLQSIIGIENVYDYKRYCNDWASYRDLFIKDCRVNTWEIERVSFSRSAIGGSGDVEDTIHNFVIRGFYSVHDILATEKTFQDLVETVCATFVNDPTLGGTAKMVHIPITGNFTTSMLGSVLCHVVTISIQIEDRII